MAIAVHASGAELQQLSSFYRLLNQASASRSEHEVMRVFVEALAVWHDSESWAYAADVTGRFVLDVALPGSDRSRVPSIIDQAALPPDTSKPARIAVDDLDTLGFRGQSHLLTSRVHVRGSSDWLIVTENPGSTDAEARLGVYVQAVAQALSEVNAVHASRLTWAMLTHLLPAGDSLVFAAHEAIGELASSIDAAAWLTVFTNDGTPVLTAGDLMSRLSRPLPTRMPSELILPLEVPAGYHAALGVRRAGGEPLTGRDEQLLRLASSTLSTWLIASIPRLSVEHERRRGPRSFDQVLKQRLDEALAEGEDVSVVVVSLGREAPGADVTHECVARIRRELRPADMAGRLSSGHIGVLLPETTTEAAAAVVDRLRHMLTANPPSGTTRLSVELARLPGNEIERFPTEHLER